MALLDKLAESKLSLRGNNFNPQSQQASFGFSFFPPPNSLDPAQSRLHYNAYSILGYDEKYREGGLATTMKVYDFNRAALGGVTAVRPPSQLDELDTSAPNLTPGGVVSQIYKSAAGRRYRELGPSEGRY
jgi:hypothetical protein